MDTWLNSPSEPDRVPPLIDCRVPPAARDLLVLSRLNAEIEAVHLQEMALFRRLEQVRRDARAAHEEFRSQEIHVMFIESSRYYTAPPETLRRLREWLETASENCRRFAAVAASETRHTGETFDRLQGRLATLLAQRRTVAIPPDLRSLYEASLSNGCSPAVVAVENKACGGCRITVTGPVPNSGVRSCSGCRRVLYWRRAE